MWHLNTVEDEDLTSESDASEAFGEEAVVDDGAPGSERTMYSQQMGHLKPGRRQNDHLKTCYQTPTRAIRQFKIS